MKNKNYDFELAPICLVCFKRLEHLSKVVQALTENTIAQLCELYVFIDNGRNESEKQEVQAVYDYMLKIAEAAYFKNVFITLRNENYGCAKNVISAVNSVFEKHEKVIYLEDDILPNKYYLEYMQEALEYHKDDELVFYVAGGTFKQDYVAVPETYTYDTYYALCSGYGFSFWKKRWQLIDFELQDIQEFAADFFAIKSFSLISRFALQILEDHVNGKINTWDIQFSYAQMKHGLFAVVPKFALAVNIGNDNSGVHCSVGTNPNLETELSDWRPHNFVKKYQLDFSLLLKAYLSSGWYTAEDQKRLLMLSPYAWQLLE